MNFIKGVLYRVPSGEPVEIPLRHMAVFGVTMDSGKTTFIEAAVDASGLRAITFRTKRGEIGFDGAHQLQLFFDERGLTHWKALEGLIAATLEEKVQREPGIRGAIISVCSRPSQATTLEEVHMRVKARMEDPKVRGFEKDVFNKLDAYLSEVLPQIKQLRPRITNKLELPEPGVYVEDLTGLSDEVQCLLIASLMKKVYEESSGVIAVLPEVWKFIPQDRGSPVKWVIEKYVREMGVVECYLWIDAQDLRGVDKKHLRSIDTRLFGRQPDPHEIEELLKALPLPKNAKPTSEMIMTLKLGHFYAKLGDKVELVYVRPRWLPSDVAVQVAQGIIKPDGKVVEAYKPKSKVLEGNDDLVYKEKYDEKCRENERLSKRILEVETLTCNVASREDVVDLKTFEAEKRKREELEKSRIVALGEFTRRVEQQSDLKADVKIKAFVKQFKEEFGKETAKMADELDKMRADAQTLTEFRQALVKVFPVGVATPNGGPVNAVDVSVSVQPTLTEFTVKVPKREVLEATDNDADGQILLLASKGWFKERRKRDHVRDELKRVWDSSPRPGTIEIALGELTAKGILEREKEGNSWSYWLAPGAEKLIKVEE